MTALVQHVGEDVAEGEDLFIRRGLAVNAHEQALDDQGPSARGQFKVVDSPLEGDAGTFHQMIVFGRACLQFGPDLAVVPVHDFEGFEHRGDVKARAVGDGGDLDVIKAEPPLDVRGFFNDLPEPGIGCGFAVARESDIVDPLEPIGDFTECRVLEDPAAQYVAQKGLQFLDDPVFVHIAQHGRDHAVHLAIDAVEVADLVGIQIDPDRDAPGTPGKYWIDVPVVLEQPRV